MATPFVSLSDVGHAEIAFIGVSAKSTLRAVSIFESGAIDNEIKIDPSVNESGIRLEFAQFGHFDSFDVIRSMVSMASVADTDLPTPIATGLKSMYYVDSDVVEGLTYHYKVRVWRGTESFVSSELNVTAIIKYENDFTSMEGLEVFGSDTAGVYIASGGGLVIGASSGQSLVVKLEQAPEFKNFEAEFDLTYLSASTSTTVLFAYRSHFWSNDAGKLAYILGANHRFVYPIRGTNSSNSSSETTMLGSVEQSGIVVGTKARIKIRVQDGQHQIFINDLHKGTLTDNVHTDAGGFGFRMWTDGNNSAKVENLVISPL